jgi:hypothetical protein
MKLTKILLLLIVFEVITGIYVFNIDTDKHYNKMFEEISKNNKYKISLTEVNYMEYKGVKVYYAFEKDRKWTYLEYMSFECNKKSKLSKSDFTIDWYDEFVKLTYKDSFDKTTQTYRIYFKDVEDSYE